MKKSFLIPVNEVPNEDELMGNKPSQSRVTESAKTAVPLPEEMGREGDMHNTVDFVWGFMFFDFPSIRSQGNKIFFTGEVSKSSMFELKAYISEVAQETMHTYNKLGIYDPKDMKLELYINSPGGCMSSGWDFIDYMDNFYMPIHTIGTGTVASMGVTLLLAGDKRFLTPNTHVLVHQFRAGIQGKRQDIMDYVKHFEHIQTQMVEYIASKTELSVAKVRAMLKNETWLPADQALSLGFADAIK